MNKKRWIERFQQKYYKFTDAEIDSARGWTCCAVGSRIQLEKPELIPIILNHDLMMDKLLTPKALRLGKKFYDAVRDNNVQEAERLFHQIQNLHTIFRDENKHYFWWSKYV